MRSELGQSIPRSGWVSGAVGVRNVLLEAVVDARCVVRSLIAGFALSLLGAILFTVSVTGRMD